MTASNDGVPERPTWNAYCEACDWEADTSDPDSMRAQEKSAAKMLNHGVATGHHETYHDRTDINRAPEGDDAE